MAVALSRIVYQRFNLSDAEWTPIIATVDCNYVALTNENNVGSGGRMVLCSDPDDADTQKNLSIGQQEVVNSDPLASSERVSVFTFRFPAASTIVYAKMASGIGQIILTQVR